MGKQLRFGVMAEGGELLAWQAECVKDLIEQADAGFEVFISGKADDVVSGGGHARGRSPWERIETFLARKIPALARVDRHQRFPDVREVSCALAGSELTLSPEECVRLRERGLAFILNFTRWKISAELAALPSDGVWSFQVNDSGKYDGRIPGFWEICNGDNLIKCALVRQTGSSAVLVLLRSGTLLSVPDSYAQTVATVLGAFATWPRIAWRDLSCNGGGAEEKRATHPRSVAVPSVGKILLFLTRLGLTRFRLMFRWWFLREQWCVGVLDKPIHRLLDSRQVDDVNWLLSEQRDRYFADPFGVMDGDSITILAEEYPHSTSRGRISSFVVRNGAVTRAPQVVLERNGHLSYPYVFQHGSKTYCVPESNALGEVALYEIASFPGDWSKVKTLLRGRYVDSTLFEHGNRWWLFASSMEHGGVANLYIWHAVDPLGEWRPHPCNPVKTDVCSSRPAGTPFVHEGRLYRPAQNCSETYGGGVAINHVKRLTEKEFEEEVVVQLRPEAPGQFPRGLHTLSAIGDKTLVDGKTYVFSLGQFFGVLKTKVMRIFPLRGIGFLASYRNRARDVIK